jgi:hypothetical protein
MHDITMNCLPILAITVLTVLGTTAAVRILVGVGKVVIDTISHHGGHHER